MADIRTIDRFARAVERLADPKHDGRSYEVQAEKGGRVIVKLVSGRTKSTVMDAPIGFVRHNADRLYAELKLHGGGPIWDKSKLKRRRPTPTLMLMDQRRGLRIKPDKPSSRNGLRNRTIRKLLAIQAAAAGGR